MLDRKKMKLMLLIVLFLFNIRLIERVEAESIPVMTNLETSKTYVKGNVSQNGVIQVFAGTLLIGKGEAVEGNFKVYFTRNIDATPLLLKFQSGDGVITIKEIAYDPVKNIQTVNDKQKILSGIGVKGAIISAYVGEIPLTLKSFNIVSGEFEFFPFDKLTAGMDITIVSEKNGCKSISETIVKEAPLPNKPRINPVSNKDLFITGIAEPYSTVYLQVADGKRYTIVLQNSNNFKIPVGTRPLKEEMIVIAYVIDSAGRNSGTVSFRVLDIIPPQKPQISAVTDKSFTIMGKTEPESMLTILRNSKIYKKIKSDKKGNFVLLIPLHSKGTIFEVYAIDRGANISPRNKVVVSSQERLRRQLLYAPIIRQMPELPRGCEVTSLAMLLNFAGIPVNKLTLASQVKKDPTPFRTYKGKKYFGNPNYGFVGDMYTFKKPGFGVFNKPIEALASNYLPNRVINLSGQSFNTVLNYISSGHPVWIINTSWFSFVPDKYWETWFIPQGLVRITYKEHSVLITGYDSKYVYINDPLSGQKNVRKPIKQFIEGWRQFGSQAISYY